jgi:hypothetical protein
VGYGAIEATFKYGLKIMIFFIAGGRLASPGVCEPEKVSHSNDPTICGSYKLEYTVGVSVIGKGRYGLIVF